MNIKILEHLTYKEKLMRVIYRSEEPSLSPRSDSSYYTFDTETNKMIPFGKYEFDIMELEQKTDIKDLRCTVLLDYKYSFQDPVHKIVSFIKTFTNKDILKLVYLELKSYYFKFSNSNLNKDYLKAFASLMIFDKCSRFPIHNKDFRNYFKLYIGPTFSQEIYSPFMSKLFNAGVYEQLTRYIIFSSKIESLTSSAFSLLPFTYFNRNNKLLVMKNSNEVKLFGFLPINRELLRFDGLPIGSLLDIEDFYLSKNNLGFINKDIIHYIKPWFEMIFDLNYRFLNESWFKKYENFNFIPPFIYLLINENYIDSLGNVLEIKNGEFYEQDYHLVVVDESSYYRHNDRFMTVVDLVEIERRFCIPKITEKGNSLIVLQSSLGIVKKAISRDCSSYNSSSITFTREMYTSELIYSGDKLFEGHLIPPSLFCNMVSLLVNPYGYNVDEKEKISKVFLPVNDSFMGDLYKKLAKDYFISFEYLKEHYNIGIIELECLIRIFPFFKISDKGIDYWIRS